jgi:hypothetical protein
MSSILATYDQIDREFSAALIIWHKATLPADVKQHMFHDLQAAMDRDNPTDILAAIASAVTLIREAQKPVCPTCGGAGYVDMPRSIDHDCGVIRRQEWTEREICPDCNSQCVEASESELPL